MQHLKSIRPETSFEILPKRIRFMAIALNLEDLNKIRYPVGICEGFDLAEFDKIILVKIAKS